MPALYLLLDTTVSMNMTDMQKTMTRWAALGQAMSSLSMMLPTTDRASVSISSRRPAMRARCARIRLPHAASDCSARSHELPGRALTAALAARSPAGPPARPPSRRPLTCADPANSQAQLPSPIDVVLLVDGPPRDAPRTTIRWRVRWLPRRPPVGTPPVRTQCSPSSPIRRLELFRRSGRHECACLRRRKHRSCDRGGLRTVRAKSANCEVALDGVTDAKFVTSKFATLTQAATLLSRANDAAHCGTSNAW